ncbi:MAG TPA: hypothetical protein VES67_26625 [Vicinamibacterales bacterium]|nr:hypothetical protein [Vicinamibacterales bacterium]
MAASFNLGTIFTVLQMQDQITGPYTAIARTVATKSGEIEKHFEGVAVRIGKVNDLVREFSGLPAMRAAEEYAAAVQKIGGAAQLTEREQAKVNAVVQEAINKYRALGQEAPPHLVELEKATRKVTQATTDGAAPTSTLTGRVKEMALGYVAGMVSLQAFERVGRMALEFVTDSINEYLQAEKAQRQLTAALTAQGAAIPPVLKLYSDLAERYQRTTVHSDDLIREMQALLVQVGGVLPSEMDKALDAVTNLSAGLGIDLRGATMMVAKSFEDNFGALKKAGVVIDETRAKTEGMTYVLGRIQEKFGGQAQAEVESYAGQLKNLTNQWNEFKEELGRTIVTSGALDVAILALRLGLTYLNAQLQQTVVWLKTMPSVTDLIANPFVAATTWTRAAAQEFGKLNVKVQELKPVASHGSQAMTDLERAIRKQRDEAAKATEAAKAHQKALSESAKAAQQAAKDYRAWADAATGAVLLRDLAILETRLKQLTRDGELNAHAMRAVADEAEGLHKRGAILSGDLLTLHNRFHGLDGIIAKSGTVTVPTLGRAYTLTGDQIRSLAKDYQDINKKVEDFNKLITDPKISGGLTGKDLEAERLRILTAEQESFNRVFTASVQLLGLFGDEGADALQALSSGIHQLNEAAETFAKGGLANMTAGWIQAGLAASHVFFMIGEDIARQNAWSRAYQERIRLLEMLQRDFASFGQQLSGTVRAKGGGSFGFELPGVDSGLLQEIQRDYDVFLNQLARAVSLTREQKEAQALANAEALNLADIFKHLGALSGRILTQDQLAVIVKKAEPLFDLAQRGGETGERAISELNEVTQIFAERAERAGGLWEDAFLDFIAGARASGVEISALNDLMRGQFDAVATGLTGFLTTGATAFDTLRNKQQELADLQSRAADAGHGERERLLKEIAQVTAEIDKQKDIIEAAGISSQQSAEAFGSSIAGVFAGLLDSGLPIEDVLEQITPAVEALETQLRETGLTGGAAFDSVRELVALLADDVSGPVLQGVLNLDDVLIGLHNTSLLNQEGFAGLTGQITQAITSLEAQGKNADQVMRILKGPLQAVWELQKDYNFEVDESTQLLLDQAEAAGIVGEKSRDPMERMINALDRMNTTLDNIARKFGALPADADQAATGIENAFRGRHVRIPVSFDVDAVPDLPRAARGGIITRRTVLVAGEEGPEAIVPLDRPGSPGVPGTGGITFNITFHAVDGASVERFVGSREFAESFERAVALNTNGVASAVRRGVSTGG